MAIGRKADFTFNARTKKAQKEIKNLVSSLEDMQNQLKQDQQAMRGMINSQLKATKSSNRHLQQINKTSKGLVRHIREIESYIVALYGVKKAYDATIGLGLEYNKMLEEETTGLKALFALQLKDVDTQGKRVTALEKFTYAQKYANLAIEEARKINVSTPYDLGQTIRVYKLLLPQVAQYSKSTKEALKTTGDLTKGLSILAKTRGLDFQQFLKTVDSALSGQLMPSELQRALASIGLSNKEVKQAMKEGVNVAELFKQKLVQISVAGDELATNWDGLKAKFMTVYSDIMGEATKETLYDVFKGDIAEATQFLKAHKQEVLDTFRGIAESLHTVYGGLKSTITTLYEFREEIKQITEVYLVYKSSQTLVNLWNTKIVKSTLGVAVANRSLATSFRTLSGSINPFYTMIMALYGLYKVAEWQEEQRSKKAKEYDAWVKAHKNPAVENEIKQKKVKLQLQKTIIRNNETIAKLEKQKVTSNDTQKINIQKTINALKQSNIKFTKELGAVEKLTSSQSVEIGLKNIQQEKKRADGLKTLKKLENELALQSLSSKQRAIREAKVKFKPLIDSKDQIISDRAKTDLEKALILIDKQFQKHSSASLSKSLKDAYKQKLQVYKDLEFANNIDYQNKTFTITKKEVLLKDYQKTDDPYKLQKLTIQQGYIQNQTKILQQKLAIVKTEKERYDIIKKLQDLQITQAKNEQAINDERMRKEHSIQYGIKKAMEDKAKQAMTTDQIVKKSFDITFDTMSNGLADFVATGKASFKDMTRSILQDLSRMMVKQAIFNAMKSAMGGSSFGSFFGFSNGGAIPTKKYASGGLLQGGSGVRDDLYLGSASGNHVFAMGGEYITNKRATQSIGLNNMNFMNKTGKLPKSDVNIVVNTYTSKEVQVEHKQEGNKHTLTIKEVDAYIRGQIGAGGNALEKTFSQRYMKRGA